MKQYLEVIFEGLPRSIEPALSLWLFRHGCLGTQEKLDFLQQDLRYLPTVKRAQWITVSAYFEPTQRETTEAPIRFWVREHSPETKIRWQLQENKDWLAEWKKHFKKFKLAGLDIVPAWQKQKVKSLSKAILIEPGMAFGTGTHATTKFALRLIERLSRSKEVKGATFLDVGAGSGILSVGAVRMGAKSSLAIDNDPESWRECQKIFKLNKVKKAKVTEKQLAQVRTTYDVVVANIIDGVLMDLKDDLWRCTKKKGHLILSGILTDGAPAFKRHFLENTSGKIIAELADKEWTALLISK